MIKNILEDVLGAGDTNVIYLFFFMMAHRKYFRLG